MAKRGTPEGGKREALAHRFVRPPKISEVPDDQALALFDMDGTLTVPGNRLLIQKFVTDVQIGTAEAREELTGHFRRWKIENDRGANPDYQQYLTDVGDSWASLLASGENSLTRAELMQLTGSWFEKRGKIEIKDYSHGVVGVVRQNLMRPIMVTGAPFEIAWHFGNEMGIDHVFGMEVETDGHDKYIDRVRHNTGLANAKSTVCTRLKEARQKILFAMGDTHADSELMYAAIGLDGSRNDGVGRAALINPRPETVAECKRWCAGYLASNRLIVIPQHTKKAEVIEAIRNLLGLVLEDNDMPDGRIDRVVAL